MQRIVPRETSVRSEYVKVSVNYYGIRDGPELLSTTGINQLTQQKDVVLVYRVK